SLRSMPDVVSPATRSRMMAGIRGAHTKPELFLRRGLHARGFRFRLHNRKLPGRPDLVFQSLHAVIFAHGCFWHGHECPLFKWPRSRARFWRTKIEGNVARDERALAELQEQGWRTAVVWECALKGPGRLPADRVLSLCASWLRSRRTHLEIKGSK